MAASRDFNALKGTERIIVYSERRPCYPIGYVPALTPNDDECVRTDCERPYNTADLYMHGGSDVEPAGTARSCSRGVSYGDTSPSSPLSPKLSAGGSPVCSSKKSAKSRKDDACTCQPARKRNRKVKCPNIPPDPKTATGYPNVREMAREIEERVGGGRKAGGGEGEDEGEDEDYSYVENHLTGGGRDDDPLTPKTVYDYDPIISSRITHKSDYEGFIPNFTPCSTCQCDLEGVCECCVSSTSESSLGDCVECDDNRDYFSEMWDSCERDQQTCFDMMTIDCVFKAEPDCCQRLRHRALKKARKQGETCCCDCPPPELPKPPPPPERCVCIEVDPKKTRPKSDSKCPPCDEKTKKSDCKRSKKSKKC